ncbi:hypothetical protein M5K25_016566 [Dendrobium thyrsiflorum]|uniref:Uncharacterized protein n=1 Tax=Dendrobium thyrsiflorum TaxID=117978 RepID=A0ABD0URV1_DENTH
MNEDRMKIRRHSVVGRKSSISRCQGRSPTSVGGEFSVTLLNSKNMLIKLMNDLDYCLENWLVLVLWDGDNDLVQSPRCEIASLVPVVETPLAVIFESRNDFLNEGGNGLCDVNMVVVNELSIDLVPSVESLVTSVELDLSPSPVGAVEIKPLVDVASVVAMDLWSCGCCYVDALDGRGRFLSKKGNSSCRLCLRAEKGRAKDAKDGVSVTCTIPRVEEWNGLPWQEGSQFRNRHEHDSSTGYALPSISDCHLHSPVCYSAQRSAFSLSDNTTELNLERCGAPLYVISPSKLLQCRDARSAKLSCMGDPRLDAGFVFDEQGRTDILGSPFFDVHFEFDETDDYVDRILYQLSLSLEAHNRPSTTTSSTSGLLSDGHDPTRHLPYGGIARISLNTSPLALLKERKWFPLPETMIPQKS